MLQDEALRRDRSRHLTAVFVFAFVVWLLLTASLEPVELVAGLLVAAVVTLLSVGRSPILAGLIVSPGAPLAMLRYLGSFALALIRSNIDMARRVLSPTVPLDPAVVRVRTDLKSELGRLVLANSITLTPGTLSVDLDGDELLVHWVDCTTCGDLEQTTRTIAADFERHLKGFLR
jgi:multicomponent Na+:H+ antiporter subunit E